MTFTYQNFLLDDFFTQLNSLLEEINLAKLLMDYT